MKKLIVALSLAVVIVGGQVANAFYPNNVDKGTSYPYIKSDWTYSVAKKEVPIYVFEKGKRLVSYAGSKWEYAYPKSIVSAFELTPNTSSAY